MRVLFLFNGYRRRDNRVRLVFINKLRRFSDVELFYYGPREYLIDNTLAPVMYDSRITASDLLSLFHPDVLLFELYSDTCYNWLPKGICGIAPSAIIEEDTHSVKYKDANDVNILQWYKDTGFSLLIKKHFYDEKYLIPSVWMPSSVNDDEFFMSDFSNKLFSIGFAGSLSKDYVFYKIRNKARNILANAGLLDKNNGMIYNGYVEYIQSHIGMLACGCGELHTCLAKTFEIPMCGTALLTNHINETNLLFGNDKCYFEYKDDCSDVVERANEIINDLDQTCEVITNAYKQVSTKHTHSKRIVELYNILKALSNNTEVPRVWGR